MVGKTGFEPATPWSQTKCSTKLSHFPKNGALEGIRTPDLSVRSRTLYPTELRAHVKRQVLHTCITKKWWLQRESNQRHRDFQSLALPTELWSQMAVSTGLEPAIFCVTGRRVNQLHHETIGCGKRIWTSDLRVMSPTSYQAAPSRDITWRRRRDSNPCAAYTTSRFSRPVPSTRLGYFSINLLEN